NERNKATIISNGVSTDIGFLNMDLENIYVLKKGDNVCFISTSAQDRTCRRPTTGMGRWFNNPLSNSCLENERMTDSLKLLLQEKNSLVCDGFSQKLEVNGNE